MIIVPVLDLSDGIVVHAKYGERAHYQAVSSTLTSQSHPDAVLSSFYNLFPFKIIYIADLDAIQNRGNNNALIKSLALEYPQCEFWLDAGIDNLATLPSDNINRVLGSENKIKKAEYIALLKTNPNIVLSLDFNSAGLLENNYLLTEPGLWPQHVIAMMLHCVGSNQGPDMQYLNDILEKNKHSDIFVAGGIRNTDDLKNVREKGIKGALIASALHNGNISKMNLEQLSIE